MMFGLMAGLIAFLVPQLLLIFVVKLWRLMAYENEPPPFQGATLGDMAGVASAFHPRTGSLLNVAASVQARANTPRSIPPVETVIDSEKL
jgi:hypothetical protein